MRPIDADALKGILRSKQIELVKHPTFLRSDMEEGIDRGIGCALLAINDAPTVGGWISVKDRLPERNQNYLITLKTPGIPPTVIMAYLGGNTWWQGAVPLKSEYVTHWMELPEPPEVTAHD